MKAAYAAVAFLLLISQARAEYRVVLIQIEGDRVTVHSDEPKDRLTAAPVVDAVKAIGEMKGWGSLVGVHVVYGKDATRDARRKVLAAVGDNPRLDLESFGPEVPERMKELFLKK